MKYSVIIPSLQCGGAERVAICLSKYWKAKGCEITIITFSGKETDFYKYDKSIRRVCLYTAGESITLFRGIKNSLKSLFLLRKEFCYYQPDVIIALMPTANILATLSSRGLHCKVVCTEHNHPPQFPLKKRWELLRKLVYPFADAVTALTMQSVEWLNNKHLNKRIVAIPNPIDWPIEIHSPIIDPLSICNEDKCIVLAVGSLTFAKGFDLLLEAFAKLSPYFSNWELVILGEGPERDALETKIKLLGLYNKVKMPGTVGNIGDWYNQADIYVMSSRVEGFGNTLAEAMAYGCPAVSFDCNTGPREIIRHGIDGILVPEADVTELKEALAKLMDNKDLREKYSKQAIEVRSRFSLDKIGNMWDELINLS